MPGGRDEISIQLTLDSNGQWRIVPLSIGPDIVLEMLPNPSSAESSISRDIRNRLRTTPYLESLGRNRYLLRELARQGQTFLI